MERLSHSKISSYWDNRVEFLKNQRSEETLKKLKKAELAGVKIRKNQKKQSRLFEQIEKNRQLKERVLEEIKAENKIDNKNLAEIYQVKGTQFNDIRFKSHLRMTSVAQEEHNDRNFA